MLTETWIQSGRLCRVDGVEVRRRRARRSSRRWRCGGEAGGRRNGPSAEEKRWCARRWRVAAVDRRSALVSSGEWRKKVTDLYPWPRVPGQKLNRYLCRP